ncbi:hypothetical protein BT69DRAFT_153907 [Atractiella rhizophila]|nr:hypothetical protein BT69DRAFT_153907 [Atractiella rhizophila]
MYHIVKYYRKSEKIRKARHLPKLTDKNELPSHNLDPEEEAPYYNKTDEIVLSPEDQEQLVYYQTKFHESHSFYRAHETATHYAFPIKLMVTIVLLLDFHSVFQSCLGGVTWGINYLDRPTWPPIFLISCSLSCSISAGVLIAEGCFGEGGVVADPA